MSNQQNETKQLAINMIFSIISFILNFCMSFFLTPYITSNFGSEAYGFVKLANEFANYATVASVALNSVASRFIMLERVQGNIEKAKKYYSSITLANIVLATILAVPASICVVFIDNIITIPFEILYQVKLVFALTFANFLLTLIFSTHSNCYYLTNRLDKGNIRDVLSNCIRVFIILLLFLALTPQISYVAVATLVATVFCVVYNIKYTKKLTPDLKFNIKDFDKKSFMDVFSSGIWNSITRLSQIFTSGLDLLITNIFIGATPMGYLSVARTVPNMLISFNSTVGNVFSPNLMNLYAHNNMKGLKNASKTAMRFMCLFVCIPIGVLMSIGVEFFQLWVPEQPANLLNILAVLTIVNACITGPLQPLYQIFTITNKVKESSIVMIVYGIVSILITYICLLVTEWGIYAVASVSLVGSVIVALCYHVPFSAKYIGLPWYAFYPEILKSILSMIVVLIIGMGINYFVTISSWFSWFIVAIVTAMFGFLINIMLILNTAERKQLLNMIAKKIRRK